MTTRAALWATWAGFAATLLGVGLARFAYTPLFPAMVEAGWVTGGEAAALGAANLVGYLVGALAAPWLAARLGARRCLKGAMLVTAVALAACGTDLGVGWLGAWRALAGVTGGVLMVVAAPTVLAALPPDRRAAAAGGLFTGIGVGIVVAGVGVPALLPAGVGAAWWVLGVVAAGLAAATWRAWPAPPTAAAAAADRPAAALVLTLCVIAYASDGIGFIPHTVFLSDYVARGLDRGLAAGGLVWAVFGAGALVGALSMAAVAARFGVIRTFVAALALKCAAVALPLVTAALPGLMVSAALVGLLTPGMVVAANSVAATLAGTAGHRRAWSAMTAAFAIAQAVGAYGLAFVFARTGDHVGLFAIGTGALVIGTAAAILAAALIALARPGPREELEELP